MKTRNGLISNKLITCKAILLTFILFAFTASFALAGVIFVDDDYTSSSCGGHTWQVDAFSNIQNAIDAAANGDTIIVSDGIYSGPGNVNMTFSSGSFTKDLTVKSENGPGTTIIDCGGQYRRGFNFQTGETAASVVDGFTIMNGEPRAGGIVNGDLGIGGAIYILDASPFITNCIFKSNKANRGGAIYSKNSNALITRCVVEDNTAKYGGGIYAVDEVEAESDVAYAVTLRDNRIKSNFAEYGGGIYLLRSFPVIEDCDIDTNTAYYLGGGIALMASSPEILRCDITGNMATIVSSCSTDVDVTAFSQSCIDSGTCQITAKNYMGDNDTNCNNENPDYGGASECTPPVKAFDDGSPWFGDSWSSSITNIEDNWIKYKLATARAINKLVITPAQESADYSYYHPSSFTLEGSNNNTDWNVLLEVNGGNKFWDSSRVPKEWFVPNPTGVAYLYYKINMTANDYSSTEENQIIKYIITEIDLMEYMPDPYVPSAFEPPSAGHKNGGGGGIYCGSNSFPTLTSCRLTGGLVSAHTLNSLLSYWGGAIFVWQNAGPVFTNCLISSNWVGTGDSASAVYMNKAAPVFRNCTITGNYTSALTTDGQIYMENLSVPTFTNCIIWKAGNEIDTSGTNSINMTYSLLGEDANSALPGIVNNEDGNIVGSAKDPLFRNYAASDFRLLSDSPCIDTGKNFIDIYSDVRGSLRPIDGSPNFGFETYRNNFEMGAYEYSAFYGSDEEDETIKAFRQVILSHSNIIFYSDLEDDPDFRDCTVRWSLKNPFPDHDLRVTQSGTYRIRLALVNDYDSRVIYLTNPDTGEGFWEISRIPPVNGYEANVQIDKTYSSYHPWRVRVEMLKDPNQFSLSTDTYWIKTVSGFLWEIGEQVLPDPANINMVDLKQEPDIDNKNLFYWDINNKTLYAIAEGEAEIHWRHKYYEDATVIEKGTNVWPETCDGSLGCRQFILGFPAVNLLPNGGADIIELMSSQQDVAVIDNTFYSDHTGWAVLVYWEGTTPHFITIRTMHWYETDYTTEAATIGERIVFTDLPECAGYNSENPNSACYGWWGFSIDEASPYAPNTQSQPPFDGFDRNAKTGPIIPVNKELNAGQDDNDLVVLWMKEDVWGVSWPWLVVKYQPEWPDDPDRIIIASGKGSYQSLKGMDNAHLYYENDKTKTGFNPNDEHAVLLVKDDSQGAQVARAFALRHDLGSDSTSQPYVLVKYQNPGLPDKNDNWEFKVFKVEAEGQYKTDQYDGDSPTAYTFDAYPATAGLPIEAPAPLNDPMFTNNGICEECRGLGPTVYGMWWNSAGALYEVGESGFIASTGYGEMPSPTPENLNGIFGFSDTSVVAVGDNGTAVHYDGNKWVVKDVPLSVADLNGVWGGAAANLFAVGDNGKILHYYDHDSDLETPLVWEEVTHTLTDKDLNAIWGISANEIYAVGDDGIILKYDGGGWTVARSSNSEDPNLKGIWGGSATNIYAVGADGKLFHNTGSGWGDAANLEIAGSGAVSTANAPTDIFTVPAGDYPYIAVDSLIRANGQTTKVVEKLGNNQIQGDTQQNWHNNGSGYAYSYSIVDSLNDITGYGDKIMIAGSDGKIFEYNGSSWSIIGDVLNKDYLAIAMYDPAEGQIVFATGESGAYFIRWNNIFAGLMGTDGPEDIFNDFEYMNCMAFWEDPDNNIYARKGNAKGVVQLYYKLLDGFYYDVNGDGVQDAETGDCLPLLDLWKEGTGKPGIPIDTTFVTSWPTTAPTLKIGRTLITAGDGLPEIKNQCSVKILYDQGEANFGGSSVKLLEATSAIESQIITTDLDFTENPRAIPSEILVKEVGNNTVIFPELPPHLINRFSYNYINHTLLFRGIYDASGIGSDPLLLPNIMNNEDLGAIQYLGQNQSGWGAVDQAKWVAFNTALTALQTKTLEQLPDGKNEIYGTETFKMLTAGAPHGGSGYVTLAFNANDEICHSQTPTLRVIKVECDGLYEGSIKAIAPENPFDNRFSFKHSGDFGGYPNDISNITFEWYAATDPTMPTMPADGAAPGPEWVKMNASLGGGLGDICIQMGSSALTSADIFKDKWIICRYKGYSRATESGTCPAAANPADVYSPWTDPVFYESWTKRVMREINLFDQRFQDFRDPDGDPATYVSMIQQAGERYEGDVALNYDPENLNSIGMIGLYETIFNITTEHTIDQHADEEDYDSSVNSTVLFAASRLSDLYMLLGNEAYADAVDPTIGFSSDSGEVTSAGSLFCFKNQAASLLEEELELLRGRDDTRFTTLTERPVYNKMIWNFTSGDGEVAYVNAYNITDVTGGETGIDGLEDEGGDGIIDEYDAQVLYPQGHGDAWGYYLHAMSYYYRLLNQPYFEWEPRSETVNVGGAPVQVDYLDERKFASAAAAKARTGAAIVNLTYRDYFDEGLEKQFTGFKDAKIYECDTDAQLYNVETGASLPCGYTAAGAEVNADRRAWGLYGWSKRVSQGIYFDWVMGNAMLPETYLDDLEEDEAPEDVAGIQKIDRRTVTELGEMASLLSEVAVTVDNADMGLNPLGIASDTVPFDISPNEVAQGSTHFEQIYGRAVQAMNNAITVFNHANQNSQMLRKQEGTLEEFRNNVEDREADFNNRLIEIFGYPYEDDIGAGGAYPAGYNGPDIYHFLYVDVSELVNDITGSSLDTVEYICEVTDYMDVDETGALKKNTVEGVKFHLSTAEFGLIKPQSWTGKRKAPGEIQIARSNLIQTKARFDKMLMEYDQLLNRIEDEADLLNAQYNVNKDEIKILYGVKKDQQSLNRKIMNGRYLQFCLRTGADVVKAIGEASAEGVPKVQGFIFGLAEGTIMDIFSCIRGAVRSGATTVAKMMMLSADAMGIKELAYQQAKEIVQLDSNIELTEMKNDLGLEQKLVQLEQLIRSEANMQLEVLIMMETLNQQVEQFHTVTAKGERLLADRLRFRQQTAEKIQEYRYRDMAFRIFRNDALQKYMAQFDLASKYVYLAAKAYDYDTGLLDTSRLAAKQFMENIVKQRTIGEINGGIPMTGSGLAEPMAMMQQNFSVLKGMMGFNNPQVEENRFSLRKEYMRLGIDAGSNDAWQFILSVCYKDNLWDVPEFRKYCQSWTPELGDVPKSGIVIPISTEISPGRNFFGNYLAGGDSYYDSSRFSTRIRGVGVWFSNYDAAKLAMTPRIYLIPVGLDIVRSPFDNDFSIREYNVVDQRMPLPYNISEADLENKSWIPSFDTALGLYDIRRHSMFRAHHDGGGDWYDWSKDIEYDTRLIGRSVWNTKWLLIIPSESLGYVQDGMTFDNLNHPMNIFVSTITDIKLAFETYSYEGGISSMKAGEDAAAEAVSEDAGEDAGVEPQQDGEQP